MGTLVSSTRRCLSRRYVTNHLMGPNSEKQTPVLKGVSMSGSLTIVDSQKSCSTIVSKKMFHRKLLRSKTMNERHGGSRRNWTVRHKLCRRLPLKTMAREQDRFLPIANISRIMKKALPTNAKIAKDAKETVQECVSEFISFVTSE